MANGSMVNDQNIRFDLLVTTPRQSNLLTAYNKALKLLFDIQSNKQVVTEDQMDQYAVRTLSKVER